MLLPAALLPQAAFIVAIWTSFLEPIPVLDVLKTYGNLASRTCYSETISPPGSSCLIRYDELSSKLGLGSAASGISKDELRDRLSSLDDFQWPLKPFGVSDSKSLEKTVTINKGAETRVYMEELERRGLYDRRNPTGPLPTSLRPKLNSLLQQEGLEQKDATIDRVFDALGGDAKTNRLTVEQLRATFGGRPYLDYYDFLALLGKEGVYWPAE